MQSLYIDIMLPRWNSNDKYIIPDILWFENFSIKGMLNGQKLNKEINNYKSFNGIAP